MPDHVLPVCRQLDLTDWNRHLTGGFEDFVGRFVDPRTGVVYDSPADPAAMAAADQPGEPFRHHDLDTIEGFPFHSGGTAWPAPHEIAASVPAVNGWRTPIENGPCHGGMLLWGLSRGAVSLL